MEASALGRSGYGGNDEEEKEETKPADMMKKAELSNHLLDHQGLKVRIFY